MISRLALCALLLAELGSAQPSVEIVDGEWDGFQATIYFDTGYSLAFGCSMLEYKDIWERTYSIDLWEKSLPKWEARRLPRAVLRSNFCPMAGSGEPSSTWARAMAEFG